MSRTLLIPALLVASCTTNIETTHPRLENISESLYASGVVRSKGQYEVFSTVNGIIGEMRVKEGTLVRKGDTLMTVRNDLVRFNVENARLAAEHDDVNANSNKLKEAMGSIGLAQARLKDDSLLLIRQRNLNARGVGTKVELEQRELAYKNSVINYQLALLGYRDLQRDVAFSSARSKTNLKISESIIHDYFIRSEIDGKVYKLFRERGELVNTLNPVAVVGDPKDFYIELNVDEYDISRIQIGHRILLTMDSYKGKVYEARVENIEPMMNVQSRSFVVDAAFITQPPELYPNLSVEANIIIRSKQKALTVPRNYLIGDSLVLVGKHETRKVRVGITDYRKAEILNGLSESDIIYKISQ